MQMTAGVGVEDDGEEESHENAREFYNGIYLMFAALDPINYGCRRRTMEQHQEKERERGRERTDTLYTHIGNK